MALSPDQLRNALSKPAKKTAPQSKNGARPLPNSIEAEQGILGSMLVDPTGAIAECVEKISPEYFYNPGHQTIYGLLVELWNASKGIDLVTFTQALRDRNQLDEVGGAPYVTQLYTYVPTAANITWYLEIIREKHILRQIIQNGNEAVRRAHEEQGDINALVDDIERHFIGLGDDRFKLTYVTMKDAMHSAIALIEDAYERKGALSGVPTGFAEIDRMTRGLQAGYMVVIAARPSMGKTSLAMNIAEHAAVVARIPTAVFSLEMTLDQLSLRMLASRAKVNLSKLMDGFLVERDFPAIASARDKLMEAPIWIDDAASLSILELRAKARRLRAMHKVGLIVVDYLQLLRSTSKRAQDNRQVEVSEISNGLKSLAKELKIPIVVLAQLNRQPENRTGGKPKLADLRESGSIEQDADLVGLLYRPEVYEDDADRRAELEGEAELIIAKNRNGPIGTVELTFRKEFTRFEDRARQAEPDEKHPEPSEQQSEMPY